jgi:hypothetical protein
MEMQRSADARLMPNGVIARFQPNQATKTAIPRR